MAFHDRVLETTTTTGTGDITPSGAVTGFRTFSSVLSDTDTFDYVIYAADANGVPTGEWEAGEGTWNAGVIERSPQSSSNSGSLVDFGAGSKYVMLSANAATLASMGGGGGGGGFSGVMVRTPCNIGPGMVTAPIFTDTPDVLVDPDGLVSGDTILVPAGVTRAVAHLTLSPSSGGTDTMTAVNGWVSLQAYPDSTSFGSTPLALPDTANVYSRTFFAEVEEGDAVRVMLQPTGVSADANIEVQLVVQFYP